MNETRLNTHPLIVIAATAVILTCLLAVGVMTGVVPSPLARERAPNTDLTTNVPPRDAPASVAQNAYAPAAPVTAPSNRATERAPARGTPPPAVGRTQSAGPSQTVAGGAAAPAPAAECANCGSVVSVKAVRTQGEAGLIGPAAGGLIGGVIGHQIGSGRGNTIATVVGAAGGAAAGTEIERRQKSTTHYVVAVRMNDGAVRHFNYAAAPGLETGDKVRVVNGRLVHG